MKRFGKKVLNIAIGTAAGVATVFVVSFAYDALFNKEVK